MGVGGARTSSKKRLTSNGSKATKSGKTKNTFDKPKDRGCIRIFSAILTRVLFALHTGVALWRVSINYPKEYLYFLSIGLFLLVLEMIFALGVRRGQEYKWFCPSVLFYLMSVVPCVWLMELSRFNAVTNTASQLGICNVTTTSSRLLKQIFIEQPDNSSAPNRTRRHVANIETLIDAEVNLELSRTLITRIRRDAVNEDNGKESNKRRRRRRKKKKSTTQATYNISITPTQAVVSDNGLNNILVNSTVVNETEETDGNAPSASEVTTAPASMTSVSTSALVLPSSSVTLHTTSQSSTTRPITAPTTTTRTSTSTSSGPAAMTVSTTSLLSSFPTSTSKSAARSVTTTKLPDTSPQASLSPGDADDGIRLDNLGSKIQEGFSNIENEAANILNKTAEVFGELDRVIDSGTWILLLHQVLLFVLVIGRWLLPKGEITRDQLSQLLLVFIGVGADILEFVTETIDGDELDETSCSIMLHFVIYAVWSWSLLQFTLVLTASKSRKTRVGFDAEFAVNDNKKGCCGNSIFASADLWGILVTLFLQDVPFLATRLYILIVYNLKHQMMIFFTGKNALVVILQIYRIVVLKLSRMDAKDDAIDESEMEPLRGTLHQLARRATMVTDNGVQNMPVGDDIRNATFKRTRDGSVVVKIHLEGEETLRKKRKKSAAAARSAQSPV